jgi:glycine/D-amino acid oxidase-like deaminating enzyme
MFSKALVHKNVNLQTHTPASRIIEDPESDGHWIVETPRGAVRTRQIVIAANAYTSSVLPEYKDKIIPFRTVCSRIVVPKDEQPPLLPHSVVLRFNRWYGDYLAPRPDGSLIVGGAKRMYLKDLGEWYDNVDDSQVIENAKDYFDGYMQKYFRGWENSGAYTDQVWSGSKSSS